MMPPAEEGLECSICLTDITLKRNCVTQLSCNARHLFCTECILTVWTVNETDSCPFRCERENLDEMSLCFDDLGDRLNLSMIKPSGPWRYTTSDGEVEGGEYKDGKKIGLWTLTNINGVVEIQGAYEDDMKTGNWILTNDFRTEAAQYKYGQKHGYYKLDVVHGRRDEGGYRNGKMHGRWTLTSPDGKVDEIEYRDGVLEGYCKMTKPDGTVEECEMRDGHWHGLKFTFAHGEFHEGELLDRSGKQGHWKYTFAGGQVEEGTYRDDVRQGHWKATSPDGTVGTVCEYRDGIVLKRFLEYT